MNEASLKGGRELSALNASLIGRSPKQPLLHRRLLRPVEQGAVSPKFRPAAHLWVLKPAAC